MRTQPFEQVEIMHKHDISGWREQLTDTGLNCKEALQFYVSVIGLLFFILVVLP
jgi:hypothetical protein